MYVVQSASLETICGITSKLPAHTLPEAAFWGRSNVGKSSLLNVLAGRRALARTSGQPGKTQTINFYNINHQLYLTDLPGYGYAKVSQELRGKWNVMIRRYLCDSQALRMVFLLVDIRHDPTENDRQMYRQILQSGFSPAIIATKADKLKRSQRKKQLEAVRNGLALPQETPLILFSAVTGEGREEVWELLQQYVIDYPRRSV